MLQLTHAHFQRRLTFRFTDCVVFSPLVCKAFFPLMLFPHCVGKSFYPLFSEDQWIDATVP